MNTYEIKLIIDARDMTDALARLAFLDQYGKEKQG